MEAGCGAATHSQSVCDPVAYLVACADGYSRFDDHGLFMVHVVGDRSSDGEYVTQICRAVLIRRRADSDEDHVAMVDAIGGIRREAQLPRPKTIGNETVKVWFEDRNFAFRKTSYLGGVYVDTANLVANFCQCGSLNQPDVAASEYSDTHDIASFFTAQAMLTV